MSAGAGRSSSRSTERRLRRTTAGALYTHNLSEPLRPITEFGAKPSTEDERRSLSEVIEAFNERHGTRFSEEDFLRFEQVNREILDEDMTEMLRNNPPDVVFSAFSQAFFRGAIRLFQRDHEMKNIVLSDAEARDQAIRHFFARALRQVRQEENGHPW